tara:strand:- start:294 stop:485 length:192 start_codon:yes stop_codon:yes gene_type:complete
MWKSGIKAGTDKIAFTNIEHWSDGLFPAFLSSTLKTEAVGLDAPDMIGTQKRRDQRSLLTKGN